MRTSALRLARTSAHFAGAYHTESLRLVECTDLLLGLAEGHAVLQLAQLGLCVRLFRFPRAFASSALLRTVVRNG